MKRFRDTKLWGKAWHRRWPLRLKLLWQYINDNCDAAGVWDPDWELASLQIGESVTATDIPALSDGNASDDGDRIIQLPCGKLWSVGFIRFQYGNLSLSCKAHGPVFESMRKHNLCHRLYDSLPHRLQEEEEDKEEDKDKEEGDARGNKTDPPKPPTRPQTPQLSQAEIEFEEVWALYPDKSGKNNAKRDYLKARKEGCQQQDVLAGLNRYLAYVAHRQKTDFPDLKHKNGSTWFHQRGWQDEYTLQKRASAVKDSTTRRIDI